jgi:hypothetical protein
MIWQLRWTEMLMTASDRTKARIDAELATATKEVIELNKTTKELAGRLTVSAKTQRLLQQLTLGVAALALLLVAAGLIAGYYLFQARNATKLDDCVQPSGKCYQDQQRRTEQFVRDITDSNHNGISDTTEILNALGRRQR